MPAHKKSTETKKLQGTFRADRDGKTAGTAPESPAGLGQPPEHFTDEQLSIWAEIEGKLPEGVATRADSITFEVLCRLTEKMRSGEASATEITLLLRSLGKFGLSPAERANVVPVPAPKKKSKWLR